MKFKIRFSDLLSTTHRLGSSIRFTFIFSLLSFIFIDLSSQVPQGFNYQAIARDGSGNPIVGATIKVKLSILTDTTGFSPGGGGIYVWEEEHTGVLTNAFGLFSVVLGDPSATLVQGVGSFSLIDWNKPKLFIGTKIANPTDYKVLGGAKLWTVPYAMVAGDLSGPVKKLAVAGETSDMEEPLFEVKNKNGQTVFAVYNEGVRIYVADGVAKGTTKGGFAIGGFGSEKGVSQKYFMVKPDSIRMYIDDTPGKGNTKGGFAIGGFGSAKGLPNNYLSVSPDSTNLFVHKLTPASSSTLNILAVDQNNVRKSMMNVNADTINIGGVMNIHNNLVVAGNIDISGTVNNLVSDIDGNSYNTVTIGTQEWMKENLKTTRYRNGDLLGTTTPATLDIAAEGTPMYQWAYGGNESNVADYGRLYTWFAITDIRNVCPTGWHVPTDAEWNTLITFLGGSIVAGGKLKETGYTHWASPNTDATNDFGFTALPGGERTPFGSYQYITTRGHYWSATENDAITAIYHKWFNNDGSDYFGSYSKKEGYSVRCLKD